MVKGGPPSPHNRTVVTPALPIPVFTADEGAIHQPIAVQVEEQQQLPLQLPTIGEFATMNVPPPAPNAGATLPAAPGQAGAANNMARERDLFWHSASLLTLQWGGWGSP